MEEKKAATQALIEGIGKEKAGADEAVEASRADEEAAAALQVTTWAHCRPTTQTFLMRFEMPDTTLSHLVAVALEEAYINWLS